MSNLNNKTLQYKTEIKEGFKSLDPENNGIIETKQLNNFNKIMNLNQQNHFINSTINSLISKKNEENDEYISSKEYISYFDEQLKDIKSKEGKEKIFNVFCDKNKESFPWTNLVKAAKEIGDNDNANKLLKLIEQSKLSNKDVNFEEFCDLLNDDYEDNIKSLNDSDNYEEYEHYKIKKKNKKNKEEEEDIKSLSSKNEDSKKSIEENEVNEAEKINKRYHRRYRDTKNKTENNDNTNNVNNNKMHTKYRKKK